jgi:hypothetical protein
MPAPEKINRKNLKRYCCIAGFTGVSALCREIKISRNTAYEAIDAPTRYPVAYPKILRALKYGKN